MMLSYFENVVKSIEQKMLAGPSVGAARRRYTLELARLGKRLYDGEHRVAWCGVIAPFDLLNAMEITSCFVEFIGASLSASGAVAGFLEKAEGWGLGTDMCAYHRAVIGAGLADMMPVPDALVGTSCPCTAGLSTIENLAALFHKPMMVLQVPQEETEGNVRFLADQLGDMISFLEHHFGASMDPERLRESMILSNESRGLMMEVFDLAAHVPSPISSRDLKDFGIVMPLFFGTREGVEVLTDFRDELRCRIDSRTMDPSAERVRLLWVQNRIQFRQPLTRMLEEELGAVVVVDELNNVTWDPVDPEDPFPGIARRMIGNSFNGPIGRRVERMRRLARRYRVHGAINPCHWGCRQGAGARGLMQSGLAEIKVPVLNLEVDCIDSRAFSEGQVRTRLEAFVEMLASRPSPFGDLDQEAGCPQ